MVLSTFASALVLTLTAAADAGVPEAVAPLTAGAFAYDPKAPLQLRVVGVEQRGEVKVLDVRFQSARRQVRAYLVEPAGQGPFPGILFVHWLGKPETSNRTQFLEEAVGLAKKGAVSLLVDGIWSEPGWYGTRRHATDYRDAIGQVIDLQRAMDLLVSRSNVDVKRVALVGHDFGAMYGVLAEATRPRAKTYVLLAPTTTFHEWFLLGKKKPQPLEAYLRQMAPLDPVRYLPQLKGSVFFQFAQVDRYVSPERVTEFSAAPVEPKRVRVYENTDHSMSNEIGRNERYRWLARELGLATP